MKKPATRSFAAVLLALVAGVVTVSGTRDAGACTCITLEAGNGAIVVGRTMEWAAFDVASQVAVIPRGCEFASRIEGEEFGVAWTTRHGVVGFDYLGKDKLVDGMNERGLVINGLYHPGYASYPPVDLSEITKTIDVADLPLYLLSMCSSTDEVARMIREVLVVAMPMEALGGIQPPFHFLVTDPEGKAIVIEFADRKVQVFDAPLGVLTNAPTYDWHMTNLRNYVGFSAAERPAVDVRGAAFAPLGHGSGAIGLPGDMTPPSRFVRAAAFSASARPTKTGEETMQESFRILDNFNVSAGAVTAGTAENRKLDLRSGTQWTVAYDLQDLTIRFHTMNNRRVRQIDLKDIDFAGGDCFRRHPMDMSPEEDIKRIPGF
ncbi:MAG: linear amide C-N hydrolase [Phycisphaera sp.]|nr:linear amide C-N hydrolase [Phycisphaera sp.]